MDEAASDVGGGEPSGAKRFYYVWGALQFSFVVIGWEMIESSCVTFHSLLPLDPLLFTPTTRQRHEIGGFYFRPFFAASIKTNWNRPRVGLEINRMKRFAAFGS
jgi:hypothetical protein